MLACTHAMAAAWQYLTRCAQCLRCVCSSAADEPPRSFAPRAKQSSDDIAQLKEAVGALDRKFSKIQSRVLLCSQQLRGLREENAQLRVLATQTLADHAARLTEVHEQSNTLQGVLGDLQDVVVRQVQVC